VWPYSRGRRVSAASPIFLNTAESEICLIVQMETDRAVLDRRDAIAAVDRVDGVFIGAADLAW